MIRKRYELGILLLISIIPITLLPFLSITGNAIFEYDNYNNKSLLIWNEFSNNDIIVNGDNVTFYANLTDIINNQSITENCTIYFNDSTEFNMTPAANISIFGYYSTRAFEEAGNFSYNITCETDDNEIYLVATDDIIILKRCSSEISIRTNPSTCLGNDSCVLSYEAANDNPFYYDNITLSFFESTSNVYILSSSIYVDPAHFSLGWIDENNNSFSIPPTSQLDIRLKTDNIGDYIASSKFESTSDTCYINTFMDVSYLFNEPQLDTYFVEPGNMTINSTYQVSLIINNSGGGDATDLETSVVSSNQAIANITEIILYDIVDKNSFTEYVINVTPRSGGDFRLERQQLTYSAPYRKSMALEDSSLIHVNYNPELYSISTRTLELVSPENNVSDVSINLSEGAGYFNDGDIYDNCSSVNWTYTVSSIGAVLFDINNETCMLNITANNTGFYNATLKATDFYQQNASINFSIIVKDDTPELCNGLDENKDTLIDEGLSDVECINSSYPGSNGTHSCVNGSWTECVNFGKDCCPGDKPCTINGDPTNGRQIYLGSGNWSLCLGARRNCCPYACCTAQGNQEHDGISWDICYDSQICHGGGGGNREIGIGTPLSDNYNNDDSIIDLYNDSNELNDYLNQHNNTDDRSNFTRNLSGTNTSPDSYINEHDTQNPELYSPDGNGLTTSEYSLLLEKRGSGEIPYSLEQPSELLANRSMLDDILDSQRIDLKRSYIIIDGKTRITEKVKNKAMFAQNIEFKIIIPKDIAEDADEIIKISNLSVIQKDPILGMNATLQGYEDKQIIYIINKVLTEEQVNNSIISDLIVNKDEQEILKELFRQKEEETRSVTNITQTYTRDTKNNKTTIIVNIDVNNTASLYNVSIFQEIPKCLVEIINEQMIEAENKQFEIINADPLIVWHFDNLLDTQKIQFTIDAVSDENCTNQIKAMAVAKDIVLFKSKTKINYLNLWFSFLIIPILAILLIWFGIFSEKIEHEDEKIKQLTEKVREMYRHGLTREQIRKKLIIEEHPLKIIEDCLVLHTSNKVHYWVHRLEISFEEVVMVLLLIFNIMEFMELLPGDLNYIQKVMSIVLMSYLMYKVSITETLFGKKNIFADITLIIAFTAMTLKNIISLAKASWQEANFVFDLYSFIINHNVIFERYVFLIGIIVIIIISLYLALKLEIKAPSLITALHMKEGKASTLNEFIVRAIAIHLILLAFFVIVFNLMMEWLAVVIDSFIGTMIIVMMLVLIVKHWRKFSFGKFIEKASSTADSFYERFLSLFHHKKTLFLGISGMLIINILTETGNYIMPYFWGLRSTWTDLYFGYLSIGHTPIFSLRPEIESLFSIQTAGFGLWMKIAIFAAYLLNMIALLFLIVLPALIWVNYYKNRKLPILEILKFKITSKHVINCILFGLFASSMFMFISRPVFSLSPIYENINNGVGTSSYMLAGVDILTSQISIDNIELMILMSIIIGIITGIIALYYEKIINIMIMPISYGFFAYYVTIFIKSIIFYYIYFTSFLLGVNSTLIAVYTLLLGVISIAILYIGGFFIISYLYAPEKIKLMMHSIPLLNRIFKNHHLHQIHYHSMHDFVKHGAKEHAIKEYVIKSLNSGHELFYIVEQLIENKWPIGLIEKVLDDIKHDKLYGEEVKQIIHYHHDPEKIIMLAEWIKKTYPEHELKDIMKTAMQNRWSEDDIMLAFRILRNSISIRQKDSKIVNYMVVYDND